jgi:2-polyprenyl-6-methoxyphenol hydroxylase-like FAD-dependent oxidoreductase
MGHVETPVLVVGGSLVGLSTSLFLAHHGVEHLVVERHPGTAIHPRAAFLMQRTVELYRGVGLQEEVIAAAEREFEQIGAIVAVDSLAGRELQWFFQNINEGVEGLSPAPRVFVTQIGLEPVLRARAAELGGRLRYSCEVVSLDVEDDGVTALVRDRGTGEESTVRARYAVAADGVRSPIRQRLGISTAGHGTFSDSITIYFRVDVRPLLRGRNLSVVYVVNPRLQGFFRFSFDGRSGFLVVNSALDDQGQRTTSIGATATAADCVRYVRDALGAPDLPVEIEDVQRWNAAAEWAERFRAGPVFLAGDSAHVMPPTGGYGGNTGVHDAHNLAWKLAYALDGRAGPGLLDTYEAERLPVARATVEQAYTRYVTRLDPGLGTEGLDPVLDDAVIDLGYSYQAAWEDPRKAGARPGSRAAHVWLHRDGRQLSTLDFVDRDFVLFTGTAGWVEAATGAADRLRVPVQVCRVGDGELTEAYGLGSSGAVLVRPDGVVAWHTPVLTDDAGDTIGKALAQALHRSW